MCRLGEAVLQKVWDYLTKPLIDDLPPKTIHKLFELESWYFDRMLPKLFSPTRPSGPSWS